MDKVFLQLYSLGEAMKDLPASLEKVAAIGYAGVEFAGYYGGLDGAGLKKLLDDNGLCGLSAHVTEDKLPEQIELLAAAGIKYVVDPHGKFTNREETLRMAEALNMAGALCKQYGMMYGYHNHTQEFAIARAENPRGGTVGSIPATQECLEDGGEYLLDILAANTDPALVMLQLDAGWAATAGVDPVAYIQKHAGRIKLVHAKESGKVLGVQPPFDMSKITLDEQGRPVFTEEMIRAFREAQQTNVPTGQGIIDWAAVKKAADAQGAEAYIVEREYDYLNDIFACIKADYEYLKGI